MGELERRHGGAMPKNAAKKLAKKARTAPVKKIAKKAPAKKAVAKKAPAKKAPAKKAAVKKAVKKGAAKKPPVTKTATKKSSTGAQAASEPLMALPAPPTDPLAVLGLPESHSTVQLRRAWRQFAARHHPDQGGDAVTFTRGRSAYESLLRRHGRLGDS